MNWFAAALLTTGMALHPAQAATPTPVDLSVCLHGSPDVCEPFRDLVMAGGFMACLSLPAGGWFCRPKAELYWHDPERQTYQAKGGPSPADMWQQAQVQEQLAQRRLER